MSQNQQSYFVTSKVSNHQSRSQSSANNVSLGATGVPPSSLPSPLSQQSQFQVMNYVKLSSSRNQYLMNMTQESPLMSANDVSVQQKNLSIMTVQNSHLKEQYRNKDIISLPNSPTSFTSPFLKEYQNKSKLHSLKGERPISSNLSRSQLNLIRAFPLTGVEEEQRQNINKKLKELTQLGKNDIQASKNESLQRGYIEKLEQNWNQRETSQSYHQFNNLVHNFAMNEVIISNDFSCELENEESYHNVQSNQGDKDSSQQSSYQQFQKLANIKELKNVSSERSINSIERASQSMGSLIPSKLQLRSKFTKLPSEDGMTQSGKLSDIEMLKQKEKNINDKKQDDDSIDQLLVTLIDFLIAIEEDFKMGTASKFYPPLQFLQDFMKKLLEMSNKTCYFLMKRKQKTVCIFIQTLLRMITKIFDNQYTYIKAEVKQRVIIQVSDIQTKLEMMNSQNKELQEKIKFLREENDKELKGFQQKILRVEELKNQYLEQAELLREQMEEFKTKQYKDYQLEQIQVATKEMIKNCAILEAQAVSRKAISKDSLLEIGKFTLERASEQRSDPTKRQNAFYLNSPMSGKNAMSQNMLNSFSELGQITFAQRYDNPEIKAAFLFSHPFSFYLQPEIYQFLYDKLLHKQSREQMVSLLETFLDELLINDYFVGNSSQNRRNEVECTFQFCSVKQKNLNVLLAITHSFLYYQIIRKILTEQKNFFSATIRITEVSLLLQTLFSSRKEIGIFYATVFGLFQDNMLTDQQFEFIVQIRRYLKSAIPSLNDPSKLSDHLFQELCEDTIFVPQKLVLESFAKVLSQHPQIRRLQERLEIFFSSKRAQINQRAIAEQRKISNSRFVSESSLILIPNLMEKLKTDNINDVIRSMENIFDKLDQKNQDKVNYLAFKKLMNNHFGIDTENESFSEYFKPFIQEESFNYKGFMQKMISLHVPDSLNEKLVSYYSVLSEICNILLLTQNQTFHDFKNRLSNLIFSKDPLESFDFTIIDQFFTDYDSNKENPLKYNIKRVSSASVYQQIFASNEFPNLYQIFRHKGKIELNKMDNDVFNKLYPQETLQNNFNNYMEYLRNIYSFLSIQEKIQIIQMANQRTSDGSVHSQMAILPPTKIMKSKNSLQKSLAVSKLNSLKSVKLLTQDSNQSLKLLPTTSIKKSQFQMQIQQSNSSTDELLDLDKTKSKESFPDKSATKPSLFSGK